MIVFRARFKKYTQYTSGGEHLDINTTLQLLVDKIPDYSKMNHKKYGPFLYAEESGFVSCYQHCPRDNKGFAGRETTLLVDGKKITYKGTLWDSMPGDKSEVPKHMNVSITEELDVWERGFTFYACKITSKLFHRLKAMPKHPEIIVTNIDISGMNQNFKKSP